MDELRLILLGVGAVFIALIYLWGMRSQIRARLRRRRSEPSLNSGDELPPAATPPADPDRPGPRVADPNDPLASQRLVDVEITPIRRTPEERAQGHTGAPAPARPAPTPRPAPARAPAAGPQGERPAARPAEPAPVRPVRPAPPPEAARPSAAPTPAAPPRTAPPEPRPKAAPPQAAPPQAAPPQAAPPQAAPPQAAPPEPVRAEAPRAEPVPPEPSRAEPKFEAPRAEPVKPEPKAEAPKAEPVRPAPQEARAGAPRQEPRPEADRSGPEKVIAMTVLAPRGQPYRGTDVAKACDALDLRFAPSGLYEFYSDRTGAGETRPVLSMAHLRNPGTFDPDTLESLETPGLLLFARLPGPLDGISTLERLATTARDLAGRLGGSVCDERRNKLTQQALGHMRFEITEFERQLRVRSQAHG